jgi:tetratricopeptide (TPR) repeat protein
LNLGNNSGKAKIGLYIFILLIGLVAANFIYQLSSPVASLNNQAIELINQDDCDNALVKLDEAMKIDSENTKTNYLRGLCLATKYIFDEAILAFDKTISLDPNHADAYFNKAKVQYHQGKYQQAISSLEKSSKSNNLSKKNHASRLILSADCYYELYLSEWIKNHKTDHQPNKAIEAYRDYLQKNPKTPDRQVIEQKIDILTHPQQYRGIILKKKNYKKTKIY